MTPEVVKMVASLDVANIHDVIGKAEEIASRFAVPGTDLYEDLVCLIEDEILAKQASSLRLTYAAAA